MFNLKEKKRIDNYTIFGFYFSLIGFIYTLIELFLLFQHSSICSSQGCKLAGHFAVFGESTLVLAGAFYFLLLAVAIYEDIGSVFFVTVGLIAEGYFLSFQIFVMHNICYFCLGVFAIIIIISLFLLISRRFPIRNYLYFFVIAASVFMVRMPYISLTQNGNYLFFSPTCPHCHQTISYLKNHDIPVKTINANEYQMFLNSFGINQIPCLIVKDNMKIHTVVGESNIEEYFAGRDITKFNYFPASSATDNTCVIGNKKCK